MHSLFKDIMKKKKVFKNLAPIKTSIEAFNYLMNVDLVSKRASSFLFISPKVQKPKYEYT